MKPVKVGVQVKRDNAASLTSHDPPTDDRVVVKWLELQPEMNQKQ
jgi:hypothetical protein